MTISNIIILSILQGLTEFLPVSSSGHLVAIPKILGLPDQGLTMDLAVHIGTLLAVLLYYIKDLLLIAKSLIFWKNKSLDQSRKLGIYIGFATVPSVIFGFIMHEILPEGIRDVRVIIANLIIFGIIMIIADKFFKEEKDLSKITFKSAMIIGVAQVLALIPGTSRSGVTISASRILGFNRTDAAKFSFLLSIPSVAGAGLIGVLDFMKSGSDASLGVDMLLAVAMSFLAGLSAISIMMRFLKNLGLVPFAIYRILLAVALIIFII